MKLMANTWYKIICISLLLLLLMVAAGSVLLPDHTFSQSERRNLAKSPELSLYTLWNGTFQANSSTYLADQFPLRETFRSAKAWYQTFLLQKKDTNDLMLYQDGLYHIEGALKEAYLVKNATNFNRIRERYFPDATAYYAVIPDKNYYLPEGTCPVMDYDRLFELMRQHMTGMKEIDLTELLSLEDYYRTDLHWKQECILPAADRLLTQMQPEQEQAKTGKNDSTQAAKYDIITLCDEFYGAYYGQAALPVTPDSLQYLTNETLAQAKVTVWDQNQRKDGQMYITTSMEHPDPYDLYLGGPVAIVTIENSMQTNGRELFLFRDSFGSSMAPLLVADYEKITLIDLRYVSADLLEQYLQIPATCDVLFMYNTSLFNGNSLSMLSK